MQVVDDDVDQEFKTYKIKNVMFLNVYGVTLSSKGKSMEFENRIGKKDDRQLNCRPLLLI